MVAGAMFAACNQAAKTEETKTDSTATTTEAAAAVDTTAKAVVDTTAKAEPAKAEEKKK
ncbi:MAG: hypothetical protein RJA07_1139 [Bacteroidota bacterium]